MKTYTEEQVKQWLVTLLQETGFISSKEEQRMRALKYGRGELSLLFKEGVKGLRQDISMLSKKLSEAEEQNSIYAPKKRQDLFPPTKQGLYDWKAKHGFRLKN